MFSRIPPFLYGIGWLALLGYILTKKNRVKFTFEHLPLLAGTAFLLANLLVSAPADPEAFYHFRYVLPSVPLILVATVIGAFKLGQRFRGWRVKAPLVALLSLSIIGAIIRVNPESRHLHNDIRNINEVQRVIGEWLQNNIPEGSWIAASDAGAARYFSNLPTIDVLGLNTPEMLKPTEEFLKAHPVAAFAVMPAWFKAIESQNLEVLFKATTRNYTVTSNTNMATQIVIRGKSISSSEITRINFVGFRNFALNFIPKTK